MKKNIFNIFTLLVMAVLGLSLTGCSEDNLDTNQYKGGVSLNAFGPSPVMRGGQLRFVGSNLDQVSQVIIPGCDPITAIDVVKSGVPSEIKVTVPKDGPTVGKVTLVTKTDQKMTTTTDLTYTEPIELTSFAPEAIMPGADLTITGDYLNLVHSVGFADGVNVSETAFKEHSRYKIVVTVPGEARTGKISLYDADLADPAFDESTAAYNTIESEDVLTVGTPTIAKIETPRGSAELQGTVTAKLGENVVITGEYLNLISSIKTGDKDGALGEYEFKNFTVSEDGKTLSFALPAEAPDGDINLVCLSGVEVPVGKLVTVAPTNLVANGGQPVKNENELVITGKDLDVIVSVTFPNCSAIEVTPTESELKVTVPEAAQEGDIVLTMANGKTVTVAYTLVKPTVTAYSANPVSAGGALSITGTDLDLVKTVTFNGSETPVEVTAENEGTIINLSVPMDAQSGAVTFNLKNGTDVTVAEISIQEAVFCYATALPGEDEEIHAGETVTLPIKNGDKLTGVEINGTACQYIVSGDKLIIGVPDNAKKGSTVRLISSNGEISYTIDFIPNTEITTVIWTGMFSAGGWAAGFQDLSWGKYDWSKVTEGTELVISVTADPEGSYHQMRIANGSWAALPGTKDLEGADGDGNITLAEDVKEYRLTLTQAMIDEMTNNGGLVLCGAYFIVTKVALVEHISLENTLWSGNVDLGSWSINWQVGDGTYGASNPNMFVEAGLKAGQTIRVYGNNTSDWWQIQFFDGHWGKQEEIGNATGLNNSNNINSGIYSLADHNGCIEIPVTETLATQLTTLNDWGYCWIIQGENFVVTKITLE